MFKEFGRFFFDLVASGGMNDFALDLQETIGSVKHSCTESKGIYPFKHQQQTSPFNLWPATGCEKHGVHSSETNYFVCGTSVSLCSLIQRTSKHLEHNFSAHFCGQAINHACSFSSFQLNSVLGFNEIDHQKTDTKRRITKRKIKQLMLTWETTGKYIQLDIVLELRIDQFQHTIHSNPSPTPIRGRLICPLDKRISILPWANVWYSMEKLAGDLLFGLKLVKLSILPMLFVQFG